MVFYIRSYRARQLSKMSYPIPRNARHLASVLAGQRTMDRDTSPDDTWESPSRCRMMAASTVTASSRNTLKCARPPP
jgi:hypothetical protein